ncbi:hypothetical protein HMPREF9135_1099 [Segatella baroniae F0067]|uniref:Uncharacterized protein n=1 Tax=Segatella baroniae F0067 TaxID=1115809 RepID=U2P1X3_9BACT|nr:hypothetical protein HMPREF9135_1099 [Segatella baroniae F0067]
MTIVWCDKGKDTHFGRARVRFVTALRLIVCFVFSFVRYVVTALLSKPYLCPGNPTNYQIQIPFNK